MAEVDSMELADVRAEWPEPWFDSRIVAEFPEWFRTLTQQII